MDPVLATAIGRLPSRHARALEWFDTHAGMQVPWPQPLADGTLLATKAKGIYKPEWSRFALSIRQTLKGPYPDRDIELQPDGTWTYLYYQESIDLGDRDLMFTNRGMLECYREGVPVGVLIQTKGKPGPRYLVRGLALVNGWNEGYFVMHGLSSIEQNVARQRGKLPADWQELSNVELFASEFDPSSVEDARRREVANLTRRQGQPGFRKLLLAAYDRRCPITGYDAEDALEAAHIVPYRGPVTNHPTNGLLLRADLHSLFDLGLLAIHETTLEVRMARDLKGTRYSEFDGSVISLPLTDALRPSSLALKLHREAARL